SRSKVAVFMRGAIHSFARAEARDRHHRILLCRDVRRDHAGLDMLVSTPVDSRAALLVMQRFLLLLLLIGADWYFDATFLSSPFSRTFFNPEMGCQSAGKKQASTWGFRISDWIPRVCYLADFHSPRLHSPGPDRVSCPFSLHDDSIYVLMSIQR